ncbi:MAG: glycosyl transferase, partial [Deltaproteobacteria bacterium DG_8]
MEEINHLRISVIIPTYNRKDELEKLLYSLNNQTLPQSQFEIIVVDDGSSDGTEE